MPCHAMPALPYPALPCPALPLSVHISLPRQRVVQLQDISLQDIKDSTTWTLSFPGETSQNTPTGFIASEKAEYFHSKFNIICFNNTSN